MGLRDTQILNSIHPWLKVRVRWLGEVARLLGGGQSLISGNRTFAQQLTLYSAPGNRPVAYPGCSQHQYGFAVDATWLPFAQVTSKGRAVSTSPSETNSIMAGHARRAGLTTVVGDDGHLQIYPGAMFREWAVRSGHCPANPPPPRPTLRSFVHEDGFVQTNPDGSREWRWNTTL